MRRELLLVALGLLAGVACGQVSAGGAGARA
jgi:hypothetical protein